MNAVLSRLMIQGVSKSTPLINSGIKYVYSTMRSTPSSRKSSLRRRRVPLVREPAYLRTLKPECAQLPLVNIDMKSYDFVILEKFQMLSHSLAKILDLNVVNGWALRAQSFKVTKTKPGTTNIEEEYYLKMYRRILQVENMPSTRLPILIEALEAATPPGVICSVQEHTAKIDQERYVEDSESRELQEMLKELKEKKERRR